MKIKNYKEWELKSLDGIKLFAREWRLLNDLKGWIILSHGQSDHSGRYQYLAQALTKANYALVMVDFHGHGKSEGKRGHISRFSRYVEDLKTALNYVRSKKPAAIFLGGYSMGGVVSTLLALENPPGVKGVFLFAPTFQLGFDPPGWKVAMVRLMAFLMPSMTVGNEVNVEDLSHDREIVEAQRNDPLNHAVISTRAFVEFIDKQEEIKQRVGEFKLPLLIMHGDQDKLAALSGSENFYSAVGTKEKRLKVYKGLYHEIFSEPERDTVIADLVGWLDSIVKDKIDL